jgi:predicted peroxiredoxin
MSFLLRTLCRVILVAVVSMPVAASAKPGLFVLVTSPDAMTQATAMILSGQALQHQTPVRMLLCGPAGDLARRGSTGRAFRPSGQSAQQMLQGIIKAGAEVDVCPLYLLNNGGLLQADLVDGVKATTPAIIGDFMDQPDVRYLSF